jgi:hypothetical protein
MAKFPNLRNGCVGRAEFSKRCLYHATLTFIANLTLDYPTPPQRQDWVCEACDVIYPLFDAILQYTIETLVLDANILRDSILVRLEMVIQTCFIIVLYNDTLTLTFLMSEP